MTTARKTKDDKLSELQMRLLEKHDYELQLAIMEKKNSNIYLDLMQEKAKLYQFEIENHRAFCSSLSKKVSGKKELRAGFIDTLVKQYKLNAGWGYCPDTGEIKQGE